MKIHEYQAKELFRSHNINVPEGHVCFSADEAVDVAQKLGGDLWVVKAQIHAGGRGKGGGVKVAHSLDEVRSFAESILGMTLITHQTGPEGRVVNRLLIEGGASIKNELYLSMVVDRSKQQVVVIFSGEGGTDIEQVAATTPDKIFKMWLDPLKGLDQETARNFVQQVGLPDTVVGEMVNVIDACYELLWQKDSSLVEINPLIVSDDNQVIALDGKINFDENALFRQPDVLELRDLDEEDPVEVVASQHDLSYISLDGDIGCMVNGAGLAMATMDIIKSCGGEPANFLDVGGGATAEKVTVAFELMLRNPKVRAILVNIFGGIMKCDVIAKGIVDAVSQTELRVPLVVRLEGTNVEEGKRILLASELPIVSASTISEAARKAVEMANRKPQ